MALNLPARLVCVALAATLGAAACGSGSGESTEGAAPPVDAEPSTAPVAEGANIRGDGPPATTPPAPGTYTFDLTGEQLSDPNLPDPGPRPATGSYIVEPVEDTTEGKVQRSRRTDETGSYQDLELLFAADGVYLEELEIRNETDQGTQAILCEPDEPVLFYPATLGVGTSWTATGECGNTGSLTYDAEVVGEETVTLGDGTQVDTMRIEQTTEIDGEDASGTTSLVVWWAPELNMQVKLDADVNVIYSVYNLTGSQEDLLASAAPA